MKKRKCCTRIFAVLAVITVLMGSLMLPIGAESETKTTIAETPTYTSPIDWLSYPSANLIPYPYLTSTKTEKGITFTDNGDGSITINGTATDYVFFNLCDVDFGSLSMTPSNPSQSGYTISGYIESVNIIYDTTNKFTHLRVDKGVTVNNKTIYPMLNIGDVAYPYQPYLPYYFQQAFDDGYLNGYDDGYNKGYEEGWQDLADQAQTDYINAIDLKPYLSANVYGYSNNVYYSQVIKDIPYTVTANKEIEMGQIFDYITTTLQKTDANKTWAEVVAVEFNFTYTYNNAMPADKQFYPDTPKTGAIIIHSDSSYPHFEIKKITGRQKTGSSYINIDLGYASLQKRENNTFYSYLNLSSSQEELLPNVETTGFILSFQKQKSNATNLAYNVKITSEAKVESESYRNGYYQGYLKGTEEEFGTVQEQAYKEGYATGEKNGFLAGKQEGLTISETGNWTNLFTAVAEAPINTFQSLFNFEILGLDMRVAFGAMMSICVLLIIIKKVIL
ncbi:MAG: hypothetical protein IJF45_02520 [Clostridia bacterium]|nr:hypothetical protein [Clostridia bacterium]